MGKLNPPQKISDEHETQDFDCGDVCLNDWLKRKAKKNESANDSRTYVVCNDQKVIGYYSIAMGSIEHSEVPSSLKRNSPNPISVVVLGRLAIDKNWQRKGLGQALLKDAILKTIAASEIVGAKALVVHAISSEAKQFYKANGFIDSSTIEMTVMLPMKDILKNIEN